ncbi:3-oxoacyl-ACP synthase [Streptomyces piniterrae]|uniref:3-oxoacyl-ACP synthase n=1 Tax=Streptomyces piniterrae TaxID=2571125 RepID=A0A4U0NRV7_9ACTN|nr:beta-ketoacyl synthase N-terminal-like domain-containing protein [Streptomyces piniterrae]TJZ57341.1 3-oxoacyl-ACP synthase [Streptomyces piniterrae]
MIITAWSAMSPHGTSDTDFAQSAVSGRPLPDGPRPVPDFEPREFLGRQGTRAMSRATALAVATAARLLTEDDDPARTGLVLGTTNGSAQSILDVNRASRLRDKPFLIQPSTIQNAAMNSIAGQTAIWHGLRGPNATLAGGRTTGLSALGYCRRLLLTGRADTILAGAAEELTEARSWVRDDTAPLAEGCAMLRLEPSGPEPSSPGASGLEPSASHGLAEVLAVTSLVVTDGDLGAAVLKAANRVLTRTSTSPDRVWAAIGSGTTDDAESKALAMVCPDATLLPPITESLGHVHSASGPFQLAAVLSHAAASGPADRLALLTSVEPQGIAVAAVLRVKGETIVT